MTTFNSYCWKCQAVQLRKVSDNRCETCNNLPSAAVCASAPEDTKIAYQIKTDGVVVETRETQEEAIAAATHRRPKSRWVEVRSPEGFQVFSEHEFNQDDHDQAVRGLISLLEESDSTRPSAEILDHLRRTVSLTKTTLLTLPGHYGYGGCELSRYQLIAKPHVAGCNKHVFVITEGYSEGYRADLYESKAAALEALVERIGDSSLSLDVLF